MGVEAGKDIIYLIHTESIHYPEPLHTMTPHQDYTVYLLLVLLTVSSFTTPPVSAASASASSKEEQTLWLLERLLERALEKRSCPAGTPAYIAEWCLNTDPNKDPIDIFGNAITASSSFADTLCSNCD